MDLKSSEQLSMGSLILHGYGAQQ